MESNKVGYWLQIVANFGLLLGLVLVAVQINQNTKIAQADLNARGFEQVYQYQLAMMGENPSKAVAKAATNPGELTDEELMVLRRIVFFWANFDNQAEHEMKAGFADRELTVNMWQGRALNVYGSNPLFATIWEDIRAAYPDKEWARIVDEQIRKIEHDTNSKQLERMREVAENTR